MIGTYTFKQNGKVIAQQQNLITTAGRKAIVDYFAGYIGSLVGSIVVGIGTAAANVADTSLNFEFFRTPVDLSSADYANNGVVFKGTLPDTVEGTIYEVGAWSNYSAADQYVSSLLLNFDPNVDTWTAGSYVATNSRIGSALQLTASASATTTSTLADVAFDLSGYSGTDQFSLAYRANNAFVANLKLRLKTDDANYYEYTINTPSSGVYTITSFNKSAMTTTGSPNWANITKVDVSTTSTAGGTGSIDFDGLRIEDRNSLREDSVLVSRTVLGTPVVKTAGLPLDVEYTITL
jgi:hypothetical protein